MTSSPSEESVWDIRLLCSDTDRKRAVCDRCGELAVNTCDEPKEIALFCEECAISRQEIGCKISREEINRKLEDKLSKSINELNNEIKQLKKTIHSLQNAQRQNASTNDGRLNELQQKTQSALNLTNEMRELRTNTDTLRQRVDSAPNRASGMYLGIICCVLLSIIGGGIYKNRNKILLLTYDDANIVYQQTFKEKMQNMVQNETVESMRDFRYKMDEMKSDLTEKIDALKANKEVISDKAWNGDIISNIVTGFRCLTYYLMKLFGEVIVIWCLVVMMKKDSTRHEVLYGGLCSVLSHLIIEICYFYPSDWCDWSVMFVVIGLNCVASLVPRKGELVPRIRNSVAIHLLIGLTCLNVMYWRVWCGDDGVGSVAILPFYVFLLCVTIFDGPGLDDQKNVWFCVHIVISFLIVIGYLFQ